MTVLDTPSLKEFALMRLANFTRSKAIKAKNRESSYRVSAFFNSLVRLVLHIAGFGLLTFAGFQWDIIAGLIIAGVSCFIFSTLFTSTSSNDQRQ